MTTISNGAKGVWFLLLLNFDLLMFLGAMFGALAVVVFLTQ